MNALLWIVQVLLAAFFLFHSRLLLNPEQNVPEERKADMNFIFDLPSRFRTFLGVAESLAAIGLIVPGLTFGARRPGGSGIGHHNGKFDRLSYPARRSLAQNGPKYRLAGTEFIGGLRARSRCAPVVRVSVSELQLPVNQIYRRNPPRLTTW